MSGIDDGGPAFPGPWIGRNAEGCCANGMSLRDWFAGQALSAILRHQGVHDAIRERELSIVDVATGCFDWADAMLAARGVAK